MEWDCRLAAIRILPDDVTVHIVERDLIIKQPPIWSNSAIKTYCDAQVVAPYAECNEREINCETCVKVVEEQQAYWEAFWRSPEGVQVIKMLTGLDKLEKQRKEEISRTCFYS